MSEQAKLLTDLAVMGVEPRHDRQAAPCDIPGCKGRREILIMDDEMRCVCRKCFRQIEGATP